MVEFPKFLSLIGCFLAGIFFLVLLILWPLWRNDDDVKLACNPEPLPKDPQDPEGFFSIESLEQFYGPLPWKDDESNGVN